MNFLNRYSDKTLRFFIIIITLYCLILSGIPLFKATISERLTVDDCRKENIINDKNENTLVISEVLPGGVSEETEMDINSNNIFLLYSDGLTEAMNRAKDEYGTERVLNILKENRDQSSEFIQSKLLNSVNVFRENTEQNDDITFVVVKVK